MVTKNKITSQIIKASSKDWWSAFKASKNNPILCIDDYFLKSVINIVSDPIFVKDTKHRWIVLNDAFCRFMGQPREKLIGKSDYDFFPKKEAEVFWKKDEEVFRSKTENINEENFTDAQGTVHIIVTKKIFYTNRSGEGFLVGLITDVTERKNLEADLKQKEEMYQKIFSSSPDSITVSRLRDGIFIDVNKGFEKITGRSKKEVLGKSSVDINIWKFKEARDRLVQEIKAKGRVDNFEAVFVNKSGKILDGLTSATVINFNGEDYLLSITRDITERKKNSEELKLKLEELEKLNKLMINRELKMIELKDKLSQLKK